MREKISYSPTDPIWPYTKKSYYEKQKYTGLTPEVKVALIEVAGNMAIGLHKSNPNVTANDMVESFRDVYNSLVMIFLIPEV